MMPLDQTSNAEEYANHIPEAVRRASQRADEIAASLAAPAEEVPAVEDNTTVVEQPAAEAPAAPAPAPASEDFEQKYKTLKGKYDAEVPTLRADANALRNQVASLERIVSAMQAQAKAPAAPATQPATTVVTDEDKEQYGEELITKVRGWARAEFEPTLAELNELKAKYAQVQQSHQQTIQATSQQSVMTTMDADPVIGSTWRQTNDSPEFLNWLQQADPFSGQVRMTLLREAFDAGNAARTMAFFRTFHAEHTAIQPDPAAAPAHTLADARTGGPTLEDLAVPGRATGQPPAGATAEKRIWTPASITRFYRDVQQNVFRGKDAERLRLEEDIIAASREGRVRQ